MDFGEIDFLSDHDRALARPSCDYCGEDTDHAICVAAELDDRNGHPMLGLWICEGCIDGEGFTGWADTPTGPVSDPFGRSCDPDGAFPYQHWSVARAALVGRADPAPRPEADLTRLDVGSVVGEILAELESTH